MLGDLGEPLLPGCIHVSAVDSESFRELTSIACLALQNANSSRNEQNNDAQ